MIFFFFSDEDGGTCEENEFHTFFFQFPEFGRFEGRWMEVKAFLLNIMNEQETVSVI